MLGIQRFFWMALVIAVVMVCFPDYGTAGWTFAGTLILVGSGLILIMSIVGSLFGLYRFAGINRFLTWLFLLLIFGTTLCFFPLEDKLTPIYKLKNGQIPTGSDMERGLQKFTFNFAFDRRNARSEKNFINQQDTEKLAQEEAQKEAARKAAAKRNAPKIEITVE